MNTLRLYVIVSLWIGLSLYIESCSFGSQCPRDSRYANWKPYDAGGFSIHIPDDVRVEVDDSGPDFFMYTFVQSNVARNDWLFAYKGNHPSFRSSVPITQLAIKEIHIGRLNAYEAKWKDRNHLFHREVVVELPYNFPSHVHFWYFGLSEEERNIADNIIQSIQS